ncbi:glycosyltransferase family 2 protein [Antrihabitans stalactiti]|uniref:Glycosyltransferase family 2 protein n=1 Tax=Antrihabitans stalactiti TaxID=2584121 RepID=A0A848KIZ6_9NOCA|nr:glycosyltransferase family 2 protein [Antrihabitans stalactiti]NMN97778.1 glycosyltransferase family 2 protein [Antrihabitans stalactiti]
MKPTVSVVIPTIGRSSLFAAVESALAQTYPVAEVIVVVDASGEVAVPTDDRIKVIHTSGGLGSSRARQFGIDSSTGSVIALLDDDDVWLPEKVASQLAAVSDCSDEWIASCSVEVRGDGPPRVWPRRLIEPRQPVADFIFRFHSPRFGGASVQTSTLLFPRLVAERVPWTAPRGTLHDDPTWLLAVRKEFPDVPIVQLREPLVRYDLSHGSLSRTGRDQSAGYIAWGREHLASSNRRTRGDYFLTSPVASAIAGGSLLGVLRSIATGLRYGTPGPGALVYAFAAIARVLLGKVRS